MGVRAYGCMGVGVWMYGMSIYIWVYGCMVCLSSVRVQSPVEVVVAPRARGLREWWVQIPELQCIHTRARTHTHTHAHALDSASGSESMHASTTTREGRRRDPPTPRVAAAVRSPDRALNYHKNL